MMIGNISEPLVSLKPQDFREQLANQLGNYLVSARRLTAEHLHPSLKKKTAYLLLVGILTRLPLGAL